MLSRRCFVLSVTTALPCLLRATPSAAPTHYTALLRSFALLEQRSGGRLGVAVIPARGTAFGYRMDERFPMCSVFKWLLAAAVLRRVDTNNDSLLRQVDVPPMPLLPHSPLTEAHAGGSMTVGALCHAVLTQSDNTAANVLLETVGGPPAVTQFARTLADPMTRLDRNEPTLNTSVAGDVRDTTSPFAIVADLQRVLLGDGLLPDSRRQLTEWMEGCQTGLDRLRAHLPQGWRAADRTGSNGEHTSNDVAVFWPPNLPPVIMAAFITQCPGPEAKRAAMLAEIGRMVREAM